MYCINATKSNKTKKRKRPNCGKSSSKNISVTPCKSNIIACKDCNRAEPKICEIFLILNWLSCSFSMRAMEKRFWSAVKKTLSNNRANTSQSKTKLD